MGKGSVPSCPTLIPMVWVCLSFRGVSGNKCVCIVCARLGVSDFTVNAGLGRRPSVPFAVSSRTRGYAYNSIMLRLGRPVGISFASTSNSAVFMAAEGLALDRGLLFRARAGLRRIS